MVEYDNIILVGIVFTLIFCFWISLNLDKDSDMPGGLGVIIFFTLIFSVTFWTIGLFIFWILKNL